MDYFKEELLRVEQELSDLLCATNRELGQMPGGFLSCYSNNGNTYYSQNTWQGGERIRKGINRKQELISELARKDFLQQLLAAAEKNMMLLQRAIKGYQSMDPADLLNAMGRASRTLSDLKFLSEGKVTVEGNVSTEGRHPTDGIHSPDARRNIIVETDEEREARMEEHWRWARAPFRQSTYKPEEKIHLTSSGIYVRSKSEALICEKLFDYGVPNRYEQMITLEDKERAPDFTFQSRDNSLFFWEHAGKMNDVKYIRRHAWKMSLYERHGIVPWKNLILTYDTVDGAINMAYVDSIIRFRILPRL